MNKVTIPTRAQIEQLDGHRRPAMNDMSDTIPRINEDLQARENSANPVIVCVLAGIDS